MKWRDDQDEHNTHETVALKHEIYKAHGISYEKRENKFVCEPSGYVPYGTTSLKFKKKQFSN